MNAQFKIILFFLMACASGVFHTIALADNGIVYSFGLNNFNQLGSDVAVEIPSPLFYLPKITQVSCGAYFSVCLDHEGFMWTFGQNNYGQLGIGSTSTFAGPQKIQDIPPVLSVACGFEHTLIITNDSNLWACGQNEFGQLCLGDKEREHKSSFTKTPFSNITTIAVGSSHSLFQNDEGEFYSCGFNKSGACGLGHFNHPQITSSIILDVPPNIVQYICGYDHSLFLDSAGVVYSFGDNQYGQLGLGNNDNQNVLNQISNIPPIKTVSCIGNSSYLLDFEGNVWSFGNNSDAQLNHFDTTQKNVPTKIESLKDIQQVSYGKGLHFLAKDSKKTIFTSGYNGYLQLGHSNTTFGYQFGKLDTKLISIPEGTDPQDFTIWGDGISCRAKSARK